MKKSKVLKITGIVMAVLLVVGIVIAIILMQMIKSIGAGNGPVADYDKRIEIWNSVAGNSSRSKLDDMNIDYKKNSLGWETLRFIDAIVGTEYKDQEQTIDTFTYLYEIRGGHEKETYEDQPYIIPYIVSDSKCAVIVIPGGGFAYKSMDGTTGEGKDIALELNEAGYSAFILHYRSNPYEYPIPQLDVQRAVRYLRYHADDFGFDSDKIGMIGFSAGGNQVGTYINLIMGNNFFPEDYTPDEIDAMEDTVVAPAMIYPALTYEYNVPMLFSMFDDESVRNESTRNELLDRMDLKQHINTAAMNQFISYGTKDGMVGMDGAIAYIDSARNNGVSVTVAVAEGEDHGYKFECYKEAYLDWLKEAFNELQ